MSKGTAGQEGRVRTATISSAAPQHVVETVTRSRRTQTMQRGIVVSGGSAATGRRTAAEGKGTGRPSDPLPALFRAAWAGAGHGLAGTLRMVACAMRGAALTLALPVAAA